VVRNTYFSYSTSLITSFIATQQIENDFGDLKFQAWLSPPDPSINYNTARDAHHHGSATWFTQHHTFQDWRASGSESLLWIHGKRIISSSFTIFTLPHAFTLP
jgi:hypothetical protein